MRMETELAQASMSQAEQRDPHAIYHMMNIKQLNAITSRFSWSHYFKTLDIHR